MEPNIFYNNEIFKQVKFNTGNCGRYRTFINESKTLLYKKSFTTKMARDISTKEGFNKYKQLIENVENIEYIGKHSINGIVVKDDCADYVSPFIHGYRLDHLYRVKDKELFGKIIKQINILLKNVEECNKNNKFSGDWSVQNLIYNEEKDFIYNIDIEGYFTYPRVPRWGNLSVLKTRLNHCIYSNTLSEYFTAIIWNPSLCNLDSILKEIPNVVTTNNFTLHENNLKEEIYDIYSLDKRCNHNKVLPIKIERLKKYNNNHLIVQFFLKDPQFNNDISRKAVNLKNMIRNKFCQNIDKTLIIHMSDNYDEARYLWKKHGNNLFDVYIKKIGGRKIISKDELKSEENKPVSVISVYSGNTIYVGNAMNKYHCYKINDNDYYFSRSENNSHTFCFSFYTTIHMICEFRPR